MHTKIEIQIRHDMVKRPGKKQKDLRANLWNFLAIFFPYRWPLFALLRPLQPEMAGESLDSYVCYNYYLDWYLKTG